MGIILMILLLALKRYFSFGYPRYCGQAPVQIIKKEDSSDRYSEPCEVSKMECFAKIVNGL